MAKIEGDENLITEKVIEKSYFDFMIFGSTYPGDYGISQVLGNAFVELVRQHNYAGNFISSSNVERAMIYDMLSRREVVTMMLFDFSSALRLAKRYPQQAFALPYSFATPQNLPPNLRIATIRLEEGTFLAGIAAASAARGSRVAIITDLPEKQGELAIYAFVQGALTLKPDTEIVAIRSDSEPTHLENHTTSIISGEKVDVIFALSINYNNVIIGSAYDSNPNVLLINSWYAPGSSPNVLASMLLSLEPVMRKFIQNAADLENFRALPPVQSYGLAQENILTFLWDEQEKSEEYRKIRREAQREAAAYAQRIRSEGFAVFNTLKDGSPPRALQNFRFQDLRSIHALH